jgi:uncharacterized protein (TIGR01244 family)
MDQLAAHFFCAAQISPADITAAKALGVDAVVCQRPDHEEPGQPSSEEVAQWCRRAGIDFIFLPVIPGQITPAHVAEFDRLTHGKQKLLGYCRTGTRAAILWAANEVAHGRLSAEEATAVVSASGRDIGAAKALLAAMQA